MSEEIDLDLNEEEDIIMEDSRGGALEGCC